MCVVHYYEQAPCTRNALEDGLTSVCERDPRADDKVFDGVRDEHFAGSGLGRDSGSDVNGDPDRSAINQLALAGVDARADLDPEAPRGVYDPAGTPDCACRPVAIAICSISGCLRRPSDG